MERQLVEIVSQDLLASKAERVFGEHPTLPLAIFHTRWVGDGYHPRKTIEEAADRVFGHGMVKTLVYPDECGNDSAWHFDAYRDMPHKVILVRCGACYGGYDRQMLYAERMAKVTGKHVVVMISFTNLLTEESIGANKFVYYDAATETLLTWRGRVQVWVADRPSGYGHTRQAYLAWCGAGVLDMLKDWSEQGRLDDIRTALADKEWLNSAYQQYVASRDDIPYILKYATFDERVTASHADMEFGSVTTIRMACPENAGAVEMRCMRSQRVLSELQLSLDTDISE